MMFTASDHHNRYIAELEFKVNLYSGGSSSAGPALVEITTARSFILDRGIVTDVLA